MAKKASAKTSEHGAASPPVTLNRFRLNKAKDCLETHKAIAQKVMEDLPIGNEAPPLNPWFSGWPGSPSRDHTRASAQQK
jgi:hypothetical protein